MMWLIILIIMAIISGLLWFYDEDLGAGLFTLIIFVMFILFTISCLTKEVINVYEEKQYDIQGLENNITTSQNTNGAFILGFGYINSSSKEKIKYYYFKVNEYGKKLETIEISNSTEIYIRETDEVNPCLLYSYQTQVNAGFFKWLFGENKKEVEIAKILVVPKDTIKIEYNVEI